MGNWKLATSTASFQFLISSFRPPDSYNKEEQIVFTL
jgi:hypothetical protein